MESLRLYDDPWPRLRWQMPLAVVLTMLSMIGFVRLLEPPVSRFAALRPLDVHVLELSAGPRTETAPARAAPPVSRPPAPKPPSAKPKPKPEPAPLPVPREVPREPMPEVPREPDVASQAPESPSAPETSAPSPPVTGPVAPERNVGRSDASAPTVSAPTVSSLPPGPAGLGGPGLGGGRMGARAIYQPLPQIPDALRRHVMELVAVARFRVAANGTAQVELTQPTSDPEINRVLLETLRRWRFFPAMQDGKPVASTIDIRVPISVR